MIFKFYFIYKDMNILKKKKKSNGITMKINSKHVELNHIFIIIFQLTAKIYYSIYCIYFYVYDVKYFELIEVSSKYNEI